MPRRRRRPCLLFRWPAPVQMAINCGPATLKLASDLRNRHTRLVELANLVIYRYTGFVQLLAFLVLPCFPVLWAMASASVYLDDGQSPGLLANHLRRFHRSRFQNCGMGQEEGFQGLAEIRDQMKAIDDLDRAGRSLGDPMSI